MEYASTLTNSCPAHADGQRKSWYPGEDRSPGVELVDGTWQVRSMEAARQVLRSRTAAQAGFNAERMKLGRLRPPILYGFGESHRTQRAALARYFAPKTVDANYRDLMEGYADQLVAEFRQSGSADVSELALRYSVAIAAQVVGLTNSDTEAMARRLQAFFDTPMIPPESTALARPTVRSRFEALRLTSHGQRALLHFHLADVWPAIRARLRQRRDDVISHLLDEGYSTPEILIECVTYAAAGMVTTREYIGMAVWHLLEQPALRERYLAADKAERYQVLGEILRLEPIVGHLYRRLTEPLEVVQGDDRWTIPAGALVDIHIRNTNADPAVAGSDALTLCPGRDLPPRVGEEVMSFGDGAHKCPGNALAIQESDVLLRKLLALPVRLGSTPTIQWDELIRGYEVRNIRMVMDRSQG